MSPPPSHRRLECILRKWWERSRSGSIASSKESVGALLGICKAVIAFEDSRDGDAWHPNGASSTAYSDSVQRAASVRRSVQAAEKQAADAEETIRRSRETLASHRSKQEMVNMRSMEAVSRYEALAPDLIECIAALADELPAAAEAAAAAAPVVADVASALAEASGLLEGTSGAQDFLSVAASAAASWKAHNSAAGRLSAALRRLSDAADSARGLFDPDSAGPGQELSLRARAARLLEALRPCAEELTLMMPQVEGLAVAFVERSSPADIKELAAAASAAAAAIRLETEHLRHNEAQEAPTARDAVRPPQAQGASSVWAQGSEAAEAIACFTAKLEGREAPDSPTALDVHEHVDRLLEQACSAERLSRMYEGWAAWI
uniref:FATC domain-containing protein n=1 Tax=Tetraselmis sp. GSL018 TaxID=582737 RepID=A0A061S780_9CHLO